MSSDALPPKPPLLLPDILIDTALLERDDPEALLEAARDFALWAINEAKLIPGEFPPGPIMATNAAYYAEQVFNGGHWQYAGNTGLHPKALAFAGNGLRLCGEAGLFAVFQDFTALMGNRPDYAQAALRRDYKAKPPEIKALDDRFFALPNEDLPQILGRWIKTLPALRPLPAPALARAKQAVLDLPEVKRRRNPAMPAKPGFFSRLFNKSP